MNEKEGEGSAEGKEIQEEKTRSGVKIEIHREVRDGWKEKYGREGESDEGIKKIGDKERFKISVKQHSVVKNYKKETE